MPLGEHNWMFPTAIYHPQGLGGKKKHLKKIITCFWGPDQTLVMESHQSEHWKSDHSIKYGIKGSENNLELFFFFYKESSRPELLNQSKKHRTGLACVFHSPVTRDFSKFTGKRSSDCNPHVRSPSICVDMLKQKQLGIVMQGCWYQRSFTFWSLPELSHKEYLSETVIAGLQAQAHDP